MMWVGLAAVVVFTVLDLWLVLSGEIEDYPWQP